MKLANQGLSSGSLVKPSSLQSTRKKLHLAIAALGVSISGVVAVPAFAGPQGGQVVGGTGSINQAGNTTTINQASDRLAIDWQSFNVDVDERVNFIQPSSSAIALNRILSHNGSQIRGQIDANGQVILVNPNGIIFSESSVVNAGGLIASGLAINPIDFLNGDYTFNALESTDGVVINNGLIHAAAGGSVSLIGQRVENNGLISAQLGAVNLAAGKEAVVTFDQAGLVGVKVTEAILQDDIGVDPAILNAGEISAEDGRILISASVSEDIFSSAVNSGLTHATSVVVHDDGSFTLGAGADVVNTGSITTSGDRGGEVVVLGDNITHSGHIQANATGEQQAAGFVELHSLDTTAVIDQGLVTTLSNGGVGGDIKLLGENVGLFDDASVNASGASGGGQTLIGGDYRGENPLIRNAQRTIFSRDAVITADAINSGSGGKIILWGNEYLLAYGNLSATGVETGGFIETSSDFVDLDLNVDVSSISGAAGTWLIDPQNITIQDAGPESIVEPSPEAGFTREFNANIDTSVLTVQTLEGALTGNANVLVETTGDGTGAEGDITIENPINTSGLNASGALTLRAHDDIFINANIVDEDLSQPDALTLTLVADYDEVSTDTGGVGDISIASGVTINTLGGGFSAEGSGGFTLAPNATIATESGAINLDFDGQINLSGSVSTTSNLNIQSGAGISASGEISSAGLTDLSNSVMAPIDITLDNALNDFNQVVVTNTGNVTLVDANDIILGSSSVAGDFSITAGGAITDADASVLSLGDATSDSITFNAGSNITLDGDHNFVGTVSVTSASQLFLNDINDLVLGSITVNNSDGTLNTIQAVGTITQEDSTHIVVSSTQNGAFSGGDGESNVTIGDLTVTGSSIAINNVTTAGADALDQNGGNVTLTATGSSLVVGAISTNGGNSSGIGNGTPGLNAGSVTLSAVSDITTGNIDAYGSDGNDSNNNGSRDFNGGNGANVTITSSSGGDITLLGITTTNGGNGDAQGSSDNDDASGGNAGEISISLSSQPGTIILGGDLSSRGGRLFEGDNDETDQTNGASGAISLVGDVELTTDVEIDTRIANEITDPDNDFSVDSPPAALTISGSINGFSAGDQSLTINALTVDIHGAVGDTASLGDLNITATDTITAQDTSMTPVAQNISATSIDFTAAGITAGAISTRGLDDSNGGTINLNAVDSQVNVGDLDSSGGDSTANGGLSGGAITINAADIITGAINTSGSDALDQVTSDGGLAGAVQITATEDDGTPSITINGDINTEAGVGLNPLMGEVAELRLAGTGTTTGSVTLGLTGANFYTSNFNVFGNTGANATDTLTGPSRDGGQFWVFTSAVAGRIEDSDTSPTSSVTFSDFDVLQGGTTADTFQISVDAQDIRGGDGADVFNINVASSGGIRGDAGNDVFNIEASATGVLEGLAGDDTFNLLASGSATSIDGGVDSDVIVARDVANTFTSTADNAGTITADSDTLYATFAGIEVLEGGSNADTFNLEHSFVEVFGGAGTDTFNVLTNAYSGSLSGGAGNDSFDIDQVVTGTINGDAGADTFTLDADVSGGVNGGEDNDMFIISTTNDLSIALDGQGGNDTLTAASGRDNTFILGDDGDVLTTTDNTLNTTIDVSEIETFNGGDQADNFTINADVSGGVSGNAGADTFTITDSTASVTLAGGNADSEQDTLTLGYSDDTTITNSTITAATGLGVISYSEVERVQGVDDAGFVDMFTITTGSAATLEGRAGNDTFDVLANAYSGSLSGGVGNDSFDINQVITGTINGDAGADTFTLDADVSGGVNGGEDNDMFIISTTNDLSIALDGQGGEDTLTAASGRDNTFIIGDDGDVLTTTDNTLNTTIGFSGIERLTVAIKQITLP